MKWIILFASITAHAQIQKADWVLKKGRLTYHVHFPLKNVEGSSEAVKGKGSCAGDSCEFLVAAPVKTFESGDGNRDNHMLEVTKAGANPMITAHIKLAKNSNLSQMSAKAEINFGGNTHTYDVKVNGRSEKATTIVTGKIPLKLSDFKMERPTLLTVPIDENIPVDFELYWE